MDSVSDMTVGYLAKNIRELPILIENRIRENGKALPRREYFFRLKERLDEFLGSSSQQSTIVLLPGLRGTGKTTLLLQAADHLLSVMGVRDVLYLTCDDLALNRISLKDVLSIYEEKFLGERFLDARKKTVLLIDEVHYDEKWSLTLKRLYDGSKNLFVIATGSSSLAIQTTDLARRAVRDDILPLSFEEYLHLVFGRAPAPGLSEDIRCALLQCSGPKDALKKAEKVGISLRREYFPGIDITMALESHLTVGGFPFCVKEQEEGRIFSKVLEVLTRIIKDDLPMIATISPQNLNLVMPILSTLAVSPSGRVSYDSLSQRFGVSKHAISNLMHGLEVCGVLIQLRPYGRISKIGKGGYTYYFATSTLRAAILWNYGSLKKTSEIYGQLLENAVACMLYRQKTYTRDVLEISFDPDGSGADLVATTPFGEVIVECGWHKRTSKQIARTSERLARNGKKPTLGVIVTETLSERLEEDVLVVPAAMFLLG